MNFELSESQLAKFKEWRETKKELLGTTAIGGAFVFSFNPTGVGTFLTVECLADNTELDLNDLEEL